MRITIELPEATEADDLTIAEILAPFRQDVAESGLTEEELVEFFEGIREEVWQEQHGCPSKIE